MAKPATIKTKADIEKAFHSIDDSFDKLSNSALLRESFIEPFHDQFPLSKNGICAMIAPMGSGKTYTYTKLMVQQEAIFENPIFETIVICSTSADFDQTVKTFKPLVKKSKIVVVQDDMLLEFLQKYMKRLLKYNAMTQFLDSNLKKPNEEMNRLIGKHRLKDKPKQLKYIVNKISQYQWGSNPHRMMLILDDFASHPMLKSKEAPLSRLLKKLRHYYINVIICVQTCKSIPKDIKRCLADVFLFPGISTEDLTDLFKEIPLGIFDRKTLMKQYSEMKNSHDLMTLYLKANRVDFKLAKSFH